MEFRRILYFIETAKYNSFSRASQNLGISQPALSYQISILEREAKKTLFDRSHKKIRLTLQGEHFLTRALKLRDSYYDLMGEDAADGNTLTGQYIISSGGTVSACILPGVIKKITKKYPDISFHVMEGDAISTKDSVLKGTADLGILTEEILGEGITSRIFLSDKIVPVVSKSHPLAGKKNISSDNIRFEKFVMFHQTSSIRRLMENKMSQISPQFEPDIIMELRGVESVIRSIKAGLGIGFISELSVSRDLKILKCRDLTVERTFYFCYRNNKRNERLASIIEEYSRIA